MTKEQLRKIFKQKRLAITEKEQVKLDDLLLIQFQQLPLDDVLLLFSYLPIAEKAEPQTELFIQYLYFRIPGLQVAYPVSDLTGNSMQAILVHDDTVYHTNRLGITWRTRWFPSSGTVTIQRSGTSPISCFGMTARVTSRGAK